MTTRTPCILYYHSLHSPLPRGVIENASHPTYLWKYSTDGGNGDWGHVYGSIQLDEKGRIQQTTTPLL